MTAKKILSIVRQYEARFRAAGIGAERIDPDRPWTDCTDKELLAHAHYLLDGIREYVRHPGKKGKTGRHLGSVQTILMIVGWQTLADSMEHNRPERHAILETPRKSRAWFMHTHMKFEHLDDFVHAFNDPASKKEILDEEKRMANKERDRMLDNVRNIVQKHDLLSGAYDLDGLKAAGKETVATIDTHLVDRLAAELEPKDLDILEQYHAELHGYDVPAGYTDPDGTVRRKTLAAFLVEQAAKMS